MENLEKMAGLKDFLTNGCNQDVNKKTKLLELYSSYKDFTKATEADSYSKNTFKEHINHLYKIKKDPNTKNLIVSGIGPKTEQQKDFKLNQQDIAKAAIAEANSEVILEEEAKNVEMEQEGIDMNNQENSVVETTINEEKNIKSINIPNRIDDLKKKRQLIDKKISIFNKIEVLKNILDKLSKDYIKKVDNINSIKEADELTKCLNDDIKGWNVRMETILKSKEN
jgi:hypothetical protein